MKTNFLPQLQYTWAAVIVGGVTLAAGEAEKYSAKKKEKKAMANRPTYPVSPYAKDELALSEREFSNGMSADATRTYTEGMDSSLATSLSAILKGGGSSNNVAEAFGADARGRQQFAMMKDQMRLQRQQALVAAYRNMNEQTDKSFMYNIDAPYKDKIQADASDAQSGQNMINSGINTVGSGIVSYYGNKAADARNEKYFSNSGGTNKPVIINQQPTVSALPTNTVSALPTNGSAFDPSKNNANQYAWGNVNVPPNNYIDFADYKPPHLE